MDLLTRALLEISNALLIPDILLLLGLLAVTVVQVGGVLAEAVGRWRKRPALRAVLDELKADERLRFAPRGLAGSFGLPALAMRELARTPAAAGKILDDLQLQAERLLGRLSLGIRLGPILGLAGTLIPLGPALVALSTGDVQTLSSRLVVAFATTVVGLVVGGGCFALHSVRSRWYTQDLNDIEYLVGRMEESHAPAKTGG